MKFQQALTLHQYGQLDQARALYESVLKKQPKHFDALHMLGVLSYQSGKLERAASLLAKAIAIDPDDARARNNYGNVLQDLHLRDEALVQYNKAIALDPAYPEAHNNRGDLLQTAGRSDAALVSYDKAISLSPRYAGAYYNRGNALKAMGRWDEAIASYDQAIEIAPDYADAHHNRGHVLAERKQFDLAVKSYDQAVKFKTDIPYLPGTRLNLKMHLCDWDQFSESFATLRSDIIQGKKVCPPFPLLAMSAEAALQLKAAQIWVADKHPRSPAFKPVKINTRHDRLRIGYFSADFWSHPVAHLIAGVFESHDRSRFEIYAFSSGPDTEDPMRQRLEQSFEYFHDVRLSNDLDVIELARKCELDIAVDLSGLTKGCRPGLFAAGVAPVQINYLGYPGSMGAPYMDYILADSVLIPEYSRVFYLEKIIYLPHSYQANDRKRKIAEKQFTRTELGLPETGFVFCCFNNHFKILPETFDGWMRILSAVPASVLWMMRGNEQTVSNLRGEAQRRGVDPARLIFANHMPLDEHLARHRLADLFLDCLPYNAHTTASDALWAGLPVVTCAGEGFASRVAASLLSAVGLPELITQSQNDFEDLAIALAHDPGRLSKIRAALNANRLTAPLFDTELITRHIEAAYEQVYARKLAGLPADHIHV